MAASVWKPDRPLLFSANPGKWKPRLPDFDLRISRILGKCQLQVPRGAEVKLRTVEAARSPWPKELEPGRHPGPAQVRGLPFGENERRGLWAGEDPDVPRAGAGGGRRGTAYPELLPCWPPPISLVARCWSS